ncbi:unnamed protein product [Closterium sp. Yama58-4]|nr:unnamed protein product [Closterium sp. Yama58-4]
MDLSTSRDASRPDAAFGKSISLPREVLEATEVNLWREEEQQLRHGCPSSPLLAEGGDDGDDGDVAAASSDGGDDFDAKQQECDLPWGISGDSSSTVPSGPVFERFQSSQEFLTRSGGADCWTAEDVPTEVDDEEEDDDEEEKAVAAKAPAWGAETWGADRSVTRSSSSNSGGGAGGRASCAVIGHMSSAAEAADVATEAAARVRAMALQAANELVESYHFSGSFTALSRPPTAPCALLGPGNARGNRLGDLPARLAHGPLGSLQSSGDSVAHAVSSALASRSELKFEACQFSPRERSHGTRFVLEGNVCSMEGNGTPCEVKLGRGGLNSRCYRVEENEPWSNRYDGMNPNSGWSQEDRCNHKANMQHTQALQSRDGGVQANVVRFGVGEPCEALGSAVLRRAANPALLSSMNPPRSPSSPLSPSFTASEIEEAGLSPVPTPRLPSRFGIKNINFAPMGIVLGRINVETPQFTVEAKTDAFEIRRYPPQMVAEVMYDGDHQNGINTAFSALAGYIGALSAPQNRPAPANSASPGEGGEKIAMTAPVLTHAVAEGGAGDEGGGDGGEKSSAAGEKIAMTAPVLTHAVAEGGAGDGGGGDGGAKSSAAGEKIAMTAPVLTYAGGGEGGGDGRRGDGRGTAAGEKIDMTAPVVTAPTAPGKTTMQFLLPASLTPATTPIPTNPAVTIHQLQPRLLGAVTFSGLTTQSVLQHKSQELRVALEAAGYKVYGDYVVGRYNPPFTLPFMRTNEILYPVEG